MVHFNFRLHSVHHFSVKFQTFLNDWGLLHMSVKVNSSIFSWTFKSSFQLDHCCYRWAQLPSRIFQYTAKLLRRELSLTAHGCVWMRRSEESTRNVFKSRQWHESWILNDATRTFSLSLSRHPSPSSLAVAFREQFYNSRIVGLVLLRSRVEANCVERKKKRK